MPITNELEREALAALVWLLDRSCTFNLEREVNAERYCVYFGAWSGDEDSRSRTNISLTQALIDLRADVEVTVRHTTEAHGSTHEEYEGGDLCAICYELNAGPQREQKGGTD